MTQPQCKLCRVSPIIRLALFFGAWIAWLLPFLLFRPRNQEKAVQVKPAARVGIMLQALAFFLVYLHTGEEWSVLLAPWRAALGIVIAVTAIVLAWKSVRVLGQQWRIDAGLNADHHLIRTGPYSVIRHPIYASMLCMLLAGVAWCGTLPLWPIALVLFLAGIEIRTRVEDSLLRKRFAAEFEKWAGSTPAYIPFLR
jgi:protein-S-isoprenylcysteine O-methyltransferase Ste14